MTLPPCMKKKFIVEDSVDCCLEANAVSTLAHFKNDGSFESLDDKGMVSNVDVIDLEPSFTSDEDNTAASIITTIKTPPRATISPSPDQSVPPRQACRSPSSLPTTKDPIDEKFCTTLYSTEDKGKINPTHHAIRRDVLEVRRTVSGKIFFQCAFCKHDRRKGIKCATVSPKQVRGIYRAMIRFMMYHVPACEHIPQELKRLSPKDTRNAKVLGTRKYWIRSASLKGLMDGEDSIVYCQPAEN